MSETPIEDQEQEEQQQEAAAVAEASAAYETGEESPATGPRLVLKRSGQETDIVFPFTPPAVVGRFDPSVGPVDIDLGQIEEGSYVSRRHAKIVFDEEAYRIQDLGSSNGTYVLREDFEKVEDAEIRDGDEISLGNARFVFHV